VRRPLTAFAAVAVAVGFAVGFAACSSAVDDAGSGTTTTTTTTVTSSTTTTTTAAPPVPGTALGALGTLPVKGRAPKTGYDRDQFGPSWADVDRNGCDTRNDILNRDLASKQWRPNTHDCVVVAGTIVDPYTGRVIQFEKARAIALQIDHVVALSDAWQKGAQSLSPAERLEFANDPVNLLAVDGPTNASKGDGDAATWLPPNRSFRCAYAGRQIAAKARYRLWVTAAERDALARILSACPGEPLPA
jgi:hypothetical protein